MNQIDQISWKTKPIISTDIHPVAVMTVARPERPDGKDMAYANSFRRIAGRRPAAPARKLGNWKLAYADFLTALCAFFLVMWIVHGVSSEDKAELARQFGGEAEFTAAETPAPDLRAETLAETIRSDAGLAGFGASVVVTAEPNLVRIDLTDMAIRPLFETGDGRLNASGRRLVEVTGSAVAPLGLPITIEGHTDSFPSETPGYSNWELSADRANSARRILEAAGVNSQRIQGVSGLSDTRPLLQDAPHLPANRRISIVLWLGPKSPTA